MSRIIIISLLFFIFSILLPSPTFAQYSEVIKDYKVQIIIEKQGTINVSETIIYDFGNLFKHGIYRDIPFIKTNQSGKKYQLDFSKISVQDEFKNNYKFIKYQQNNDLIFKIGDPNSTITGVHTYIINYTVAGALTYFSDHDELYWNAIGDEWTVPIEKMTVNILFGNQIKIDPNDTKLECFGENCTFNIDENNNIIFTDQKANYFKGLTIVVGWPKNIVSVLEPKPYVTFWETALGKLVILIGILTIIFWYLIYPFWLVIKWYLYGRDPYVGIPVTALFDIPKNKNNIEMRPAELGFIINEKLDQSDITATFVDLARRGYFRIKENKKNDYSLIKNVILEGGVKRRPIETLRDPIPPPPPPPPPPAPPPRFFPFL